MIDYREILRLHSQNHSQRRIETSVHSSHQTVKAVLENAAKYGISWPLDNDMTTEKLDVVVVLVEVEIEVAAALRAFQQAGEYAGLLRDRVFFAARPFLERLHLFPSLAVNDSLMDIEEDRPVFLRVFDPLFHLVGL